MTGAKDKDAPNPKPSTTGSLPADAQLHIVLERIKDLDRRADERATHDREHRDNICERLERVEDTVKETRTDVGRVKDSMTELSLRHGEVHADVISRIHDTDNKCKDRDDHIDNRLRTVEKHVVALRTTRETEDRLVSREVTPADPVPAYLQPTNMPLPPAEPIQMGPSMDPFVEEKKQVWAGLGTLLKALGAAITLATAIGGAWLAGRSSGATDSLPPTPTISVPAPEPGSTSLASPSIPTP